MFECSRSTDEFVSLCFASIAHVVHFEIEMNTRLWHFHAEKETFALCKNPLEYKGTSEAADANTLIVIDIIHMDWIIMQQFLGKKLVFIV